MRKTDTITIRKKEIEKMLGVGGERMIDEPPILSKRKCKRRTSELDCSRSFDDLASTMTPETTRDDVAQNASAAPSRRLPHFFVFLYE